MRAHMPLKPRRRVTFLPRVHVMNGGRVVRRTNTHGVKFSVNGSHFYFDAMRNRFVLWARRGFEVRNGVVIRAVPRPVRCKGCTALVSKELTERDLCQRCRQ